MGEEHREEVLNVKLADLLSERGVLSVPEDIRKTPRGVRLPDVTVADFWGIRTVIEGRIADSPNVEASLEADAQRRVDEGLAQICVAVVYPEALRRAPYSSIKDELAKASFRVRVFTESEKGEWNSGDANNLVAILRRAYDGLVKEEVLVEAVRVLEESVESASGGFLESAASATVLRGILGIPPETGEPKEDDEEEE